MCLESLSDFSLYFIITEYVQCVYMPRKANNYHSTKAYITNLLHDIEDVLGAKVKLSNCSLQHRVYHKMHLLVIV